MPHSQPTAGAAVAALVVLAAGTTHALHPLVGAETLLRTVAMVEPVPLDITDTIQQIDRILESVLDLVQTINQLFGEGAEGAGGAAGD